MIEKSADSGGENVNAVFPPVDLMQATAKHDVISFDIFDTLIQRRVLYPADVFGVVAEHARYNGIRVEDFARERRDAERCARRASRKQEVTIDEIYANLKGATEEERVALKNLEIRTELQLCAPRTIGVSAMRYAIEQEKKVLLISDMYLPAEVIRKMLCKCGVPLDLPLYLSSEIGLTKRRAGLFRYAMQKEKIKKNTWLHIGDSLRADVIVPRLLGISAYPLRKREIPEYFPVPSDSFERMMIGHTIAEQSLRYGEDSYDPRAVGYAIYGPMLYGFSQWIASTARNEGIRTIFFLSRDGYLCKKVFDQYYKDEFQTRYCLVSRWSLLLPALASGWSFEEMVDHLLMELPQRFTFSRLLHVLHLNMHQIGAYAASYNLTEDLVLDRGMMKYGNVSAFLKSVFSQLLRQGEEEKNAFLRYFLSLYPGDLDERIMIVDVGWHGSIQRALEQITNKSIYGCYIGIAADCGLSGRATGWISSTAQEVQDMESYLCLIEMVFSAPHGTAERYAFTDKKHVRVCIAQQKKSETRDRDIVHDMRQGALDFVRDMTNAPAWAQGVSSTIWHQGICKIGQNPTLRLARLFGDIEFQDVVTTKLAAPKSMFTYLFHPRCLHEDFAHARWKIAFMKRLFKVSLPYKKIYGWLKHGV